MRGHDLTHIDLKTAFLQGEKFDGTRSVVCQLPPEMGYPPHMGARLKAPLPQLVYLDLNRYFERVSHSVVHTLCFTFAEEAAVCDHLVKSDEGHFLNAFPNNGSRFNSLRVPS